MDEYDLEQVKREIVESRSLSIKTNNLVNALAADVKSIAKRHQTQERRLIGVGCGERRERCLELFPFDTAGDEHESRAAVAVWPGVEVDGRQEKIGFKIREAQLQKIPYMLVAGDREAAEGTVAVRSRVSGDLGSRPVAEFIDTARAEVAAKSAASPVRPELTQASASPLFTSSSVIW